jgi:hypothetical protein
MLSSPMTGVPKRSNDNVLDLLDLAETQTACRLLAFQSKRMRYLFSRHLNLAMKLTGERVSSAIVVSRIVAAIMREI